MEASICSVEATKDQKGTEVPDWVGPVLEKFKAEVCAEVTARVAYSVKLMLNQNLEEVKAALKSQIGFQPVRSHRRKNDRKVGKEMTEGEKKLQYVANDGLLAEVAKQLENYNCKSSGGSPTLTESSCDETENSVEDAKPIQHIGLPSSETIPRERKQEKEEEQTEKNVRDSKPCAAATSTEVAYTEKPVSVPSPEESTCSVVSVAENVVILEPQVESQQDEETHMASYTNIEDKSISSFVEQNDTAFLNSCGRQRAASYSSTSSEFEIVPLTAAITDSQHSYSSAETRALSLSFSEDDSDTEDYVNIQKLLRSSLGLANPNNASSTVPRDVENPEIFTELDQARSALQRILQMESPPAESVGSNGLETSTMTVVGAAAEDQEEPVHEFDTRDGQNELGHREDPSTVATDSIDQEEEPARAAPISESAAEASPPAKVFTETLFQQVDEFEKTLKPKEIPESIIPQHEPKPREPEKQENELPWLPSPYEFSRRSQLSRTRYQHREAVNQNPFLVDNIFAAEPEWPSRQTRASPRRNAVNTPAVNLPHPYDFLSSTATPIPAANRPSQRRVEVLEPLYPTDVPTETLWEDALTRAAQVYNSARTAVGEISDTFSHVKLQAVSQLQNTRRDPPKDFAAEPRNRIARRGRPLRGPRDPEELQYLEEMGFHNRQLNARLLEQHNNDLEAVIATLLELQDGW